MFKLLLIKEFQRLKEIESNQYNLEWNVKRILSKTNYLIQTDAIKEHILPVKNYSKETEWLIYAEYEELIEIKTLANYSGRIPKSQRKKVMKWAKSNQAYLLEKWDEYNSNN